MAKLADAADLGSAVEILESSSLSARTELINELTVTCLRIPLTGDCIKPRKKS